MLVDWNFFVRCRSNASNGAEGTIAGTTFVGRDPFVKRWLMCGLRSTRTGHFENVADSVSTFPLPVRLVLLSLHKALLVLVPHHLLFALLRDHFRLLNTALVLAFMLCPSRSLEMASHHLLQYNCSHGLTQSVLVVKPQIPTIKIRTLATRLIRQESATMHRERNCDPGYPTIGFSAS